MIANIVSKIMDPSLLSHVSKIMESIIYDEIYNHSVTNNLLSDSQHGFRKKKCTTINLL